MKPSIVALLLILAVVTSSATAARRSRRGQRGFAGPAGDSSVVTYRPGGPSTGSIYADFGQLCAFIKTTANTNDIRWTIQIDASYTGGGAVISGGVYSLPSSVAFVGLGNPDYLYPTLIGDNAGVIFSPPPFELSMTNLQVVNNASTPWLTINETMIALVSDSALLGPIFAAVDGGIIEMILYAFADILHQDGLPQVVTIDANSSVYIEALEASLLADGAVTIATDGQLRIDAVDSVTMDPSYLTLDGTTVFFKSKASQISGISSGASTLSLGGESLPITVPRLTSTSRIVATYNDQTGSSSIGTLIAPTNLRVVGSPGSFVVQSLTPTTSEIDTPAVRVMVDHGGFDWIVIDTDS